MFERGVVQHEINELLRRTRQQSTDKDAIMDEIAKVQRAIVFPKWEPKNDRLSLADRMVDKKGSNVRMFAGKVLQMVVVLGLFCQLVLKPKHRLILNF